MDGAFSDVPAARQARFRAADLEPGETADGSVLVTNEGDTEGMFWMSPIAIADRRGPIGGRLSERLQVTVLDVTVADEPLLVYTGGLTDMGARPLGFVGAGRSRIYSVAATLLGEREPKTPGARNAYEGSSTSVSFEWRAIAGGPPSPAQARSFSVPDVQGPELDLAIPRRQRLLETAEIRVDARCDEPCKLEASLRLASPAPGGGGGATTTLDAPAGRRTAVRIAFGPRARVALQRGLTAERSLKVILAVTARDPDGNQTTARRRIRLRPST